MKVVDVELVSGVSDLLLPEKIWKTAAGVCLGSCPCPH